MPNYDFKCSECGEVRLDKHLPIAHLPMDLPKCCGDKMDYYITSAPMVHWKDYDLPDGGFKSVATPGREVITSLKEKREYMKRNNLLDANEVMQPPTKTEEQQERLSAQASIDAITPDKTQMKQLKERGLLDPTD